MRTITKETKRHSSRTTNLLIFAILAMTAAYVGGIFAVLQNAKLIEEIQEQSVTNAALQDAINFSFLHDAFFFLTAATKLEYTAHDPAVLEQAYQMSVIKGPANSENVLGFAMYAISRNELDQAEKLFNEAVRRFPTHSYTWTTAGISLYSVGRREAAAKFLKRGLLLDPGLSRKLYPMITTYRGSFDDLLAITPTQPESMIQLCQYLASRPDTPPDRLLLLIQQVVSMPLEPEQRLRIAGIAIKAGFFPLARSEVERLRDHSILGRKAMELLAEIDKRQTKAKIGNKVRNYESQRKKKL